MPWNVFLVVISLQVIAYVLILRIAGMCHICKRFVSVSNAFWEEGSCYTYPIVTHFNCRFPPEYPIS